MERDDEVKICRVDVSPDDEFYREAGFSPQEIEELTEWIFELDLPNEKDNSNRHDIMHILTCLNDLLLAKEFLDELSYGPEPPKPLRFTLLTGTKT